MEIPANVMGSVASTPNSRLRISRVKQESRCQTNHHAGKGERHPSPDNETQDVALRSAQRDANPNFSSSLIDQVRHHAVDANRCENQRDACEDSQKQHRETSGGPAIRSPAVPSFERSTWEDPDRGSAAHSLTADSMAAGSVRNHGRLPSWPAWGIGCGPGRKRFVG